MRTTTIHILGALLLLLLCTANLFAQVQISSIQSNRNCQSGNYQLIIQASNGLAPYSYSIDNGQSFQLSPVFNALAPGSIHIKVKDALASEVDSSISLPFFPVLIIDSLSVRNASCDQFNGSINIHASGMRKYQYRLNSGAWQDSNRFENLAPGFYSVNVKDSLGCIEIDQAFIFNQSAPSINVSAVLQPTCLSNNGWIQIVSSGTSNGLSYALDTGQLNLNFQSDSLFTGLGAGDYTFFVQDENGCIDSVKVSLVATNNLAIQSVSSVNANCNQSNGAISLVALGGIPPYQYSINGGSTFQLSSQFNNLNPGTYFLTVKDQGNCVASQTFTLQEQEGPLLQQALVQDASCGLNNGFIQLIPTGGNAPYKFSIDGGNTFQQNPIFNNLPEANYFLQILDADSCSFFDTITVSAEQALRLDSLNVVHTNCNPNTGSIELFANGAGVLKYSIDGGASFQLQRSFNNLSAGLYQVKVQDSLSCLVDTVIYIDGQNLASIDSVQIGSSSCGKENGAVKVFASQDSLQYTLGTQNAGTNPDFDSLKAGLYWLFTEHAKGCKDSILIEIPDQEPSFIDSASVLNKTCTTDSSYARLYGLQVGVAWSFDKQTWSNSQTVPLPITGLSKVYLRNLEDCWDSLSFQTAASVFSLDFIQVNHASCNNAKGSFRIFVSGGTKPYLYSFDGGLNYFPHTYFQNLGVGNYQISVKDFAGCRLDSIIEILPEKSLSLDSIFIQNENCSGQLGKVEAFSSSAQAYKINNGNWQNHGSFPNLTAGLHTLSFQDAYGCIFDTTFFVDSDGGPGIDSVQIIQPFCGNSNGQIVVFATGAGLRYSINGGFISANTFSMISAGSYLLKVRDSLGCESVQLLEVDPIFPVTLDLLAKTPAYCAEQNGSFEIKAKRGVPPYRYSLNGGSSQSSGIFSGLSPGLHQAVVEDSLHCLDSITVFIDSIPQLKVEVQSIPASCSLNNASIYFHAFDGLPPYQFSIDSGQTIYSSANFSNLSEGVYHTLVKDDLGCEFYEKVQLQRLTELRFDSIVLSHEHCNQADGIIQIYAQGDGLEYGLNELNWKSNPSFYNLNLGLHKISIRDSLGCKLDTLVDVPFVKGVRIDSLSIDPVNCDQQGGAIEIFASQGTRPYMYSWDNGVSWTTDSIIPNLSPDSYQVIVEDAVGCKDYYTVSMSPKPKPRIYDLGLIPLNCGSSTGAINPKIVGGESPFLYSLNGGTFLPDSSFFNIPKGIHFLEVKDARGCTDSMTFEMIEIPNLNLNSVEKSASSCAQANGALRINLSGGLRPYSYSIDGGVSFDVDSNFLNLYPGTYQLKLIDSLGCEIDTSIQLKGYAKPQILSIDTLQENCGQSNGEINLLISADTTYSVYLNGVLMNGNQLSGLSMGSYTVEIVDANLCATDTNIFLYSSDGPRLDSVVYQPASCGNANGKAFLFISNGQKPYSYYLNGLPVSLNDLQNLQVGAYELLIEDAKQCLWQDSLMIPEAELPSFTVMNVSNTKCGEANGSVQLGRVTGTAPFYFSIDGVNWQLDSLFSQLSPGLYTISLRDAKACVFSTTVEVLEGLDIQQLNLVKTAPICGLNSGSIQVSATGGVAPFQYSINGGAFSNNSWFKNLAAGSYLIQVQDAQGCTKDSLLTLEEVERPGFNQIQVQNASCQEANGSILISGKGLGQLEYSINFGSWQTDSSFLGLGAGTHIVSLRDSNNCRVDSIIELIQLGGIQLELKDLQHATCGLDNGSIQLGLKELGGGLAQVYLNGVAQAQQLSFANLSEGTYNLRVEDLWGCSDSLSLEIQEFLPPRILQIDTTYSCATQSFNLLLNTTGGNGVMTFSLNGSLLSNSGIYQGLGAGDYLAIVTDSIHCSDTINFRLPQRKALRVQVEKLKYPSCGENNGSIQLKASGDGPFQFSINSFTWQQSATFDSLSAGNYTVFVKDPNGCSASTMVELNKAIAPQLLISELVNPICGYENGEITLTANGLHPFTYAISTSSDTLVNFYADSVFTALAEGAYTLYAKDSNGCVSSQQVSLFEHNTLMLSGLSSSIPDCDGGNGFIELNVNGGTPPLRYSINNGQSFRVSPRFDSLTPGMYQFSILDAKNCELLVNYELKAPRNPQIDAIQAIPQNCDQQNGEIVLFLSSGKAPYEVSIDGGNTFQQQFHFTGLAKGWYPIQVKDQKNCFVYDTVYIDSVLKPKWTSIEIDTSFCDALGGSIRAEAEGVGLSFSIDNWLFEQDHGYFYNIQGGYVNLSLRDAYGCTQDTLVYIPSKDLARIIEVNIVNDKCSQNQGEIEIISSSPDVPLQYSIDAGKSYQDSGIFKNLEAGFYWVQIKHGPSFCSDQRLVEVKDTEKPFLKHVLKLPSTCGENNGSLQITPQYPGLLVAWNGGDYDTLYIKNKLAPGQYTLSLLDSNGCSAEVTIQLDSIPNLSMHITQTRAAFCGEANGKGALQVLGGTAPYSLELNGQGIQFTDTLSGLLPGWHQIKAVDALNCVKVDSFYIPEIESPGFTDIFVHDDFCGASGAINIIPKGNRPYLYRLNSGPWQDSGSFRGLSAGSYLLEMKDSASCSIDSLVQVNAQAQLKIDSLAAYLPACADSSGELVVRAIGGIRPYTYSLNGQAFVTDSVFHSLISGWHTVRIVDKNLCVQEDSVFISKADALQLQIDSVLNPFCAQQNGFIGLSAIGGLAPYSYSINNINTDSVGKFSQLSAGVYQLKVTDAKGCEYLQNFNLVETPSLSLDTLFTQPSLCGLSTGGFVVQALGGQPPYSYSIDGVNYLSDSVFSSLSDGLYDVHIKDALGCEITHQVEVVAAQSMSIDPPIITPAKCDLATGSVFLSAQGAEPILYALEHGSFSTSPYFPNLKEGRHSFKVLDANHCLRELTYYVPATKAVTVDMLSVQKGCVPMLFQPNLNGLSPADTCFWIMPSGDTLVGCNPEDGLLIEKAGNYDLRLVINTQEGCSLDTLLYDRIQAIKPPNAQFNYFNQGELRNGSKLELFSESVKSLNHTWSLNGQSFSNDLEDVLELNYQSGDSTYTLCLEVENELGCKDELCIEIRLEGEFSYFIANAFSPNGDDLNEQFTPIFEQLPEVYSFQIYNRWGEQVFFSKSADNAWKGEEFNQGKACPEGAYAWRLRFYDPIKQKWVNKTGSVLLIR